MKLKNPLSQSYSTSCQKLSKVESLFRSMMKYLIRQVNELKDVQNDTVENDNEDNSLTKVR